MAENEKEGTSVEKDVLQEKLSAKNQVDAARGILSEASILLSEEDVDHQTVLFLLDRAERAISKCRPLLGAEVDSEKGA